MKGLRVVRVLQLIGLLLLLGYLVLLHYANPQTVRLPFLIWLPTAWVVGASLLLGFLSGWLSLSPRVVRLGRENRTLHQRLIKAGLEAEPEPTPARVRRVKPPTRPPADPL